MNNPLSKGGGIVDKLRVIDRLEIISIVDNTVEIWSKPEREDVERFFKWYNRKNGEDDSFLVAGEGLSFLVRTSIDEENSIILFDTAKSATPMSNNVEFLGLDLNEVESIVLSHGHDDHFGGLLWSLHTIKKQGVPVYIHPQMPLRKGYQVKSETGKKIRQDRAFPSTQEIENAGGTLVSEEKPVLLANGMLLRTGEIPRQIEQEKANHLLLVEGKWVEDPYILEDVSLVANVKGKGIVVIAGCSHAGIINIVREAMRLTEEDRVHAIIGGFHMARLEKTHLQTIQELHEIDPKLLVPCHCTGWRARHAMSNQLPDAYVEGGVGHRYIIEDVTEPKI